MRRGKIIPPAYSWLAVRVAGRLLEHRRLPLGADPQATLAAALERMQAQGWKVLHHLTYPSPGYIFERGDEERDVTIERMDPTLPPDAPQRCIL